MTQNADRRRFYDVHGLVSLQVEGAPRRDLLPDVSDPMRHFRVPNGGASPDILILLGGFEPVTKGCCRIGQDVYVREDYIYCHGVRGALRWEADIQGLIGGRTCVRFRATGAHPRLLMGQLSLAFSLFVRHIVASHLARKGYLMLHAAGAVRRGRAVLFVGNGSTYKTSLLMRLVRSHRDWQALGDDIALVGEDGVFGFPVFPGALAHRVSSLATEEMGIRGRVSYLIGEICDTSPRIHLESHGLLAALVLCSVREHGRVQAVERGRSEVLARCVAAALAESHHEIHLGHGGTFAYLADAYRCAFASCSFDLQIAAAEEILDRSTREAQCIGLELPRNSSTDQIDAAVGLLERAWAIAEAE